jgi:hypothetical protein
MKLNLNGSGRSTWTAKRVKRFGSETPSESLSLRGGVSRSARAAHSGV